MRYKAWITLLLCIVSLACANVSISTDSSSKASAEDSLILLIHSDEQLPSLLGLTHAANCNTSVIPATSQPIPGIEIHAAIADRSLRLSIAPNDVPAGPLCLQMIDLGTTDYAKIGSALAITRLSKLRQAPQQVGTGFPWTTTWTRPSTVPWTHVQLIERDSIGSKQERVISDLFTQEMQFSAGTQSESWIAPKLAHWLRIANAYDSASGYTDQGSWVIVPVRTHFDSLTAPILRLPDTSAAITRAQVGSVVNFFWQLVSDAASYQMSLFHKVGNQWQGVLTQSTSDTNITIPTARIPAGTLRWLVSAVSNDGRRSQSLARNFTLDAGDPIRTLQISLGGVAVNGAKVQISCWTSGSVVQGVTGTLAGSAGLVKLALASGNADVSVQIPQQELWTTQINITDTAQQIAINIPSNSLSTLRGLVVDMNQLPFANAKIQLQPASGNSFFANTNSYGQFAQLLPAGFYTWRLLGPDGSSVDSNTVQVLPNSTKDLGTLHLAVNMIPVEWSVQSSSVGVPFAHIQIQRCDGSLFQEFSTDTHGNHSAYLPEGAWVFAVDAPGFQSSQLHVNVHGFLHQNISLLSGSLIISGSVSISEEATLGKLLKHPLIFADVLAWDSIAVGDTLRTSSNANGDFSLGVPYSGVWLVAARSNSKMTGAQSTHVLRSPGVNNLNLEMALQARIEGSVKGLPNAKDSGNIDLIDGNNQVIARTKIANDGNGNWSYLFRDIAPADYRLLAHYRGYAQTDTPVVSVIANGQFQGRGTVDADTLHMASSTGSISIYPTYLTNKIANLPALAHVLLPIDTIVSLPDTLVLGKGQFEAHIIPQDAGWIPLWNLKLQIPATSLLKDSLLFPCYHSHNKSITPYHGDSLRISLSTSNAVDSVLLHVRDSVTNDYRTIVPTSFSKDSVVFIFKPRIITARLSYWFEAFADAGASLYKNPPPLNQFDLPIDWPAQPFHLYLDHADTVFAIVGTELTLAASAHTKANDLDYTSILKNNGSGRWNTSSATLVINPTDSNFMASTIKVKSAGLASISFAAQHGDFTDTISFIINAKDSIAGTLILQDHSGLKTHFVQEGKIKITAAIIDSLGKEWTVPANISTSPSQASTGYTAPWLNVDSTFIGVCNVIAKFQGKIDTLALPLQTIVQSNALAKHLHHDSLVQVWIPDSMWKGSSTFAMGLLRFQGLTRPSNTLPGLDTVTGFFNFILPQGSPKHMPQLALRTDSQIKHTPKPYRLDSLAGTIAPISAPVKQTSLAKLNLQIADTLALDSARTGDTSWILIRPAFALPSFFGLLSSPDSTRKASLSLMPNPFSPYVTATIDGNTEPGCAVHFTPYLPGEAQVVVRIEIASLSGEILKNLVDNKTLDVTDHVVYWNGLTDSGHMARNGRYVVLMSLRKTVEGKILYQTAKPLVVFK